MFSYCRRLRQVFYGILSAQKSVGRNVSVVLMQNSAAQSGMDAAPANRAIHNSITGNVENGGREKSLPPLLPISFRENLPKSLDKRLPPCYNPYCSGRLAQLVEHALDVRRVSGSSPLSSTKKEVTFVYQKLLLFLSKPQAWHIITRQRVYHRRRRISSAEGCITCGLMRCNTAC